MRHGPDYRPPRACRHRGHRRRSVRADAAPRSAKSRRARAAGDALLIRGDIRYLPFRRATFPLVMAPYGILQSLTREADLAATLASVARVMPKGARFGIDLVPDLVRWEEYSGQKTLSGKMGRETSISLVESVRQDRAKRLTIFDQRTPPCGTGAPPPPVHR